MRVTGLWVCTAALLAACQAPPASQQAAVPDAGAAGCPAPGSRVEMLRAGSGARANTASYLKADGPAEEGLCVIRSGPDRRQVVSILGRPVHADARREYASLQSQVSGLQVGSRASGFVNLPEATGMRSVQIELTYRVLRDEAVKVPAGAFDTVVVQEQGRNGSCMTISTAWLDKATRLPVKFQEEALNCLQVRQTNVVAGRVQRG